MKNSHIYRKVRGFCFGYLAGNDAHYYRHIQTKHEHLQDFRLVSEPCQHFNLVYLEIMVGDVGLEPTTPCV